MRILGDFNDVNDNEIGKEVSNIEKDVDASEADKEKLKKVEDYNNIRPQKVNMNSEGGKLDKVNARELPQIDDDKGKNIEKQNQSIKNVESGKQPLESNKEKGNYGEMKTDQDMRNKGYDRISKDMITDLEDPGHQGIDGVYENKDGHPPYIIADSKYGSAQLKDTDDGKQMSENWIDKRLDASVGPEKADEIRMARAINPNNVGSYVSHVDEKGNVTYDKLDDEANVMEKDVKI